MPVDGNAGLPRPPGCRTSLTGFIPHPSSPVLPPNLRDYHLEVRCPRCGGRARWEEPFELVPNGELRDGEAEGMPAWGPWRVREKFPSGVRWTPPPRGHGYVHACEGVLRCGTCHAVAPHRLSWPSDAFFQWYVRGVTLYAWHADHARVLLHYIGSALRDPGGYGSVYRKGLQRLPAAVLDGHARARTASRIADTLRAHGIPLHPPAPSRERSGADPA